MPCRDGGPSQAQIKAVAREHERKLQEIRNIEAFLCAICTALNDTEKQPLGKMRVGKSTFDLVLDRIDWEEAGVTREELLAWWKKHQEQDEARRLREQMTKERETQEAERAKIREKALSKLSPEERDAVLSPAPQTHPATEYRWFRVEGHIASTKSPTKRQRQLLLREYCVPVPNTGSYHGLTEAAREWILRFKHFEVTKVLAQSSRRDTL